MGRKRQFFEYFSSCFKKIDNDFVRLYLDKLELKYFNCLFKSERQHSINVAKKSLEVFDKFDFKTKEEQVLVVKMCLLHDIGKVHSKVNIFSKVIIVMLKNKRLRKFNLFLSKDRVYKYFRHSKYSFDMLKNFDYSHDFLYSIRFHHSSSGKIDNKYIKILKYCDDIIYS